MCDSRNRQSLIKHVNPGDYNMRQSGNFKVVLLLHTQKRHRLHVASQMWCLSMLLPLIIHEWIPGGNCDWELFCDLIKIVDIVFAPIITKGTTTYLLNLFKNLKTKSKKSIRKIPSFPLFLLLFSLTFYCRCCNCLHNL